MHSVVAAVTGWRPSNKEEVVLSFLHCTKFNGSALLSPGIYGLRRNYREIVKLSGMYPMHKLEDFSGALGKIDYLWPVKVGM